MVVLLLLLLLVSCFSESVGVFSFLSVCPAVQHVLFLCVQNICFFAGGNIFSGRCELSLAPSIAAPVLPFFWFCASNRHPPPQPNLVVTLFSAFLTHVTPPLSSHPFPEHSIVSCPLRPPPPPPSPFYPNTANGKAPVSQQAQEALARTFEKLLDSSIVTKGVFVTWHHQRKDDTKAGGLGKPLDMFFSKRIF